MRLEVISRLPDSLGKRIRHIALQGVEHIGVFGNEPYAIHLHNDGPTRLGVRVSIDGTDILTGAPATQDPGGSMLMINAYGRAELKAWPESRQGGAAFMFKAADQSVAAHTHGDERSIGVIAAAVFVEGYEPPRFQHSYDSLDVGHTYGGNMRGGLESLTRGGAGTGAGNYERQEMHSTTGFREPRLREVIRLHYLWWDDLQAALAAAGQSVEASGATGFPGDAPRFTGISLGNTPRGSMGPASGRFERLF